MQRKPALLLHLLNVALRPIIGLTKASSKQLVALPQEPPVHDREAWCAYWEAQGQPWRTEPEIDAERQAFLTERRAIRPTIQEGIYPFSSADVHLNRADLEWLLATHESDGFRGPVNWYDQRQRERKGIDLRGASLAGLNLRALPLARMQGGLTHQERVATRREESQKAVIHLEGANLAAAHLEGASLARARLDNANLYNAYCQHAELVATHFEGAYMGRTRLEGASLRRAFFNAESELELTTLASKEDGTVAVADVRWDNVNLAPVNWSVVNVLEDERNAQRHIDSSGHTNEPVAVLRQYETAVRAYRQLAVALQNQGLNEDAARFAYRAQVLQRRVFWFETIQGGVKLSQRGQALGAWLFSWFLFLISGYGYRLWRSFLAYVLVIIGFTMGYYLLGASFKPSLSLVNALGLSMTSFHGRGFFPGVTQLDDTLTILASIEAFVGLVLEATFIATLTQRFFGK